MGGLSKDSKKKQISLEEITKGISHLKGWFRSKKIKEFLNEKKSGLAIASGVCLTMGAGAVAALAIGGPLLALSLLSWGGSGIAQEALFSDLWEEIKNRLGKSKGKKELSNKEAAEYIFKLTPSEIETIATDVYEKFKDNPEIKLFLTNIVKEAILSKDFKELVGQTVTERIRKENEKLIIEIKKQHEEILKEIRKCGLQSLDEIIHITKEKDLDKERETYEDGFTIFSWIPIIYKWDSNRSISSEIKEEIINGNSVLILGESASGKSNLLKRIAYDFYQQGWKVFEKNGAIIFEKALENLKTYGKSLILIDDAFENYIELDSLLKKIAEYGKKISIISSERTEKWFTEGKPTLDPIELKEKHCTIKYLKLTSEDIKNFLKLKYTSKSYKKINEETKVFVENFAGKPGEFLLLQLFYGTKSKVDLLEKKYNSIIKNINKEELKILRNIFIIRQYEGDYPKHVLDEQYQELEELYNILFSLNKKKLLSFSNNNIETYHPFLCKHFIKKELRENQITEKIIRNYLLNFLNALPETIKNYEIFAYIGSNISNENKAQFLPISINFFNKAIKINGLNNNQKAIVLYSKGVTLENMPNGKRYQDEDYMKKAIECYDKSLKFRPNFEQAWDNKGVNLYRLELFNEAIYCYDKALEINNNFASTWNNKGSALAKIKDFQNAIKSYSKALKINPKFYQAWQNKGMTYEEMPNGIRYENKKYIKKAIECYDKALKINPKFNYSLISKGRAFMAIKNYKNALNCVNKVLKQEPENSYALSLKAQILNETHNYKRAISYCKQALDINPNDVGALVSKGLALEHLPNGVRYENRENVKKAITCYDKAIGINPKETEIWKFKGLALDAIGEIKEAIRCYDEAIKINPNDVVLWLNKGVAFEHMPDNIRYQNKEFLKKAIQCYSEGINREPKYAKLWLNNGVVFFRIGEFDKAILCYDRVLEIESKNIEALSFKAVALEKQKEYEKAFDYITKAIKLNQNDEKLWYLKGDIFQNKGKYNEAVNCFNKALKINPRFIDALVNKGYSLIHLGKFQETLNCCDKALQINPNNDNIWFNKGVALEFLPNGTRYENIENIKMAIKCYDEAFKINPNHIDSLNNKSMALLNLNNYKEGTGILGMLSFKFYQLGVIEKNKKYIDRAKHYFKLLYELRDKAENSSICYEGGIAYAAILCLDKKLYDMIIAECWKYKAIICDSARIVFKYLYDYTDGRITEIKDEKDFTFNYLLNKLKKKY